MGEGMLLLEYNPDYDPELDEPYDFEEDYNPEFDFEDEEYNFYNPEPDYLPMLYEKPKPKRKRRVQASSEGIGFNFTWVLVIGLAVWAYMDYRAKGTWFWQRMGIAQKLGLAPRQTPVLLPMRPAIQQQPTPPGALSVIPIYRPRNSGEETISLIIP
jgi:hypothetical protein